MENNKISKQFENLQLYNNAFEPEFFQELILNKSLYHMLLIKKKSTQQRMALHVY